MEAIDGITHSSSSNTSRLVLLRSSLLALIRCLVGVMNGARRGCRGVECDVSLFWLGLICGCVCVSGCVWVEGVVGYGGMA